MILGEGAGVVVLEELASAEARGAKIYGEVLARGSSTVLSPAGVADRQRAMENALAGLLHDERVNRDSFGHVHAHGLSTRLGDAEEARALKTVFGEAALPVMASKSHFGNLGAGSGMVELIASLLALQEGQIPGMMNLDHPATDCPLQGLSRSPQAAGERFVSLSVTPQAQAAAIAVGQLS